MLSKNNDQLSSGQILARFAKIKATLKIFRTYSFEYADILPFDSVEFLFAFPRVQTARKVILISIVDAPACLVDTNHFLQKFHILSLDLGIPFSE